MLTIKRMWQIQEQYKVLWNQGGWSCAWWVVRVEVINILVLKEGTNGTFTAFITDFNNPKW